MVLSYNGSVLIDHIEVPRGSDMTIQCSASSNPPTDTYSWNIADHIGGNLTIESIQDETFVNCTATNEMVSTSGLVKTGYSWVAVQIQIFCKLIVLVDTCQNVKLKKIKRKLNKSRSQAMAQEEEEKKRESNICKCQRNI